MYFLVFEGEDESKSSPNEEVESGTGFGDMKDTIGPQFKEGSDSISNLIKSDSVFDSAIPSQMKVMIQLRFSMRFLQLLLRLLNLKLQHLFLKC